MFDLFSGYQTTQFKSQRLTDIYGISFGFLFCNIFWTTKVQGATKL
jgi:hypothetical protein